MKVTCPYCGNIFNDTLEKCPSCGSPNRNVVRTVKGQPRTIEELAEWYRSKGLPPYKTTRFFIGENYPYPKAFGIYKDKSTGNFVVYKNNADGIRKIRYEGTDEAYAVNELFQRLKQEIIEQKSRNVANAAAAAARASGRSTYTGSYSPHRTTAKRSFVEAHPYITSFFVGNALLFGVAIFEVMTTPDMGYYNIDNSVYYHMSDVDRSYWYRYDGDDIWTSVNMADINSKLYSSRKLSQEHLISHEWSELVNAPDITDNVVYKDYKSNYTVSRGYYDYDDVTYYHLSTSHNSDWYIYDTEDESWESISVTKIPDELTHGSVATDFYFTPTWDSSTQFSDFTDTDYYSDYISSNSSSSSSGSSYSSRWDNDDDDDYSWGSGSSYSSRWDNDDDNDYSWGSGSSYSWSSGSTDWNSDW